MNDEPRSIASTPTQSSVRFTVATLVTSDTDYAACVASLRQGGFDGPDVEYIFVDNRTANTLDAYAGINRCLTDARGDYVILCHQDVRLLDDKRIDLEARLRELETLDPSWAVAGNAGGIAPGRLALRITDPHGANQSLGEFPAQVQSLDENFIVARREARVRCSSDLQGFHLYGADLCLQAHLAGHTAYVIDFHLAHMSAGNKSTSFHRCVDAFEAKYARVFAGGWLQTTCTLLRPAPPTFANRMARALKRPVAAVSRRLHRTPANRRKAPQQTAATLSAR